MVPNQIIPIFSLDFHHFFKFFLIKYGYYLNFQRVDPLSKGAAYIGKANHIIISCWQNTTFPNFSLTLKKILYKDICPDYAELYMLIYIHCN